MELVRPEIYLIILQGLRFVSILIFNIYHLNHDHEAGLPQCTLHEKNWILVVHKFFYNAELNDERKIICLRKSEVSVERISVCNVTEKINGAWHTHAILISK